MPLAAVNGLELWSVASFLLITCSGRKKVRTFGMMKYLCEHISSPDSAGKH